ncbi:MAG: sulfatase [Candidatus Hydrogenedentota bacterium]|nr:MAG: sulfatase [Candidatus Hydrogenedentota bacterium]
MDISREELSQLETRREFIRRSAYGIGTMALGSMLNPASAIASETVPGIGVVNPLHFAPKAKRVIFLYMAGGPSHLETFDYKPELARLDGKPMPDSFTQGQPIAQLQGKKLTCMGPLYTFNKHGQSGQEISSLLPHTAKIADDICIIRSMQTEQINHDPAHTFMNTGSSISGRPSMGSWMNYGLGSESENLPGFVVMTSKGGGQGQPIAARQWHSGFLPSKYQGVQFRSQGDPVLYAGNPDGVDRQGQRDVIDAIRAINESLDDVIADPEIATRISQYEMAFRMQTSVPELSDLSEEPQHILDMYGVSGKADGTFASNCLLARRMAERGVRFIQLYHRGWDHHSKIREGLETVTELVDQASAALVMDLKQRGMLDDTLVIWGGEFGRTPMAQGDGRDHHIRGFSLWMAGGGVKGGVTYGSTDELGYAAVENPVHVHDFHATMLHLLGIDHERFTHRFQGRDFRLTDVFGHVVKPILA